jgi:flagellar biosynthesis protein FlhG
MEDAKVLDKLDVMIIDTGAGIGDHIQMFLNAADDVVVVTVPDPAAITDAYATIKTIAILRNDINVIMNQVKNEREAKAIFDKINKVAQINIGSQLSLKLLGKINSDIKVSSSIKKRELFTKVYAFSQPTKDIENIANSLMNNLERDMLVTSNESGLRGLFTRLMEHF